MKNITYKFSLFFLLFFTIMTIPTYSLIENNDSEKIIYLTFDDGPGGKTHEKILDTLKKENVPATFFLIGSQIKGGEDIVLRMKNEGHSIGLHSFTHNRSKLYASPDSFLNEMLKTQDAIYEVTGDKPTILRFPFGCNNSTYTLTNSMVDTLHNNNLKIYDWNVDTRDGGNYNVAPSTLYERSLSNREEIFLLMHCTVNNKATAEALPTIIQHYKNKGYVFKPITDETPEIFRLKKR